MLGPPEPTGQFSSHEVVLETAMLALGIILWSLGIIVWSFQTRIKVLPND